MITKSLTAIVGLLMLRAAGPELSILTPKMEETTRFALCGTDYWGGRSNDLAKDSEVQITAVATTNIHHSGTHSGCSGTFEALPYLEKSSGPSSWNEECTGSWKSLSHSSSGTNILVWHSNVCSGLGAGYYRSRGRHRGFDTAIHVSDSAASTDISGEISSCQGYEDCVGLPPCSSEHVLDEECNCCKTPPEGSPILLDLGNDGYHLTAKRDGVFFDLNGDGRKELLPWTAAWTSTGVDDAWLALDRNNNGVIDDGKELFGNFTPQPDADEPHGFSALAVFDQASQGGDEDGWIDSKDSVFERLRLWSDRNHDGVSQPGELVALPSGGVERISLNVKEARRTDRWGNAFRYRAAVESNRTPPVGPWAYDVFLDARR